MDRKYYQKAIDQFKEVTKHPPVFLSASPEFSDTLKVNLKELYDFSQLQDVTSKQSQSNVLPKLIVDNLDSEQIWQQIELHNDSVLTKSVPKISGFLAQRTDLVLNCTIIEEDNIEDDSNSNDSEDCDGDDELVPDDGDFSDNEEFDEPNSDNVKETPNKLPKNKSVVDDEFFKLSEMEEFLRNEENKSEGNDKSAKDLAEEEEDEENSDDESIDFFENQEIDEEDENEAKMAKFKDYFVQKDELTKKQAKKSFLSDEDDGENILHRKKSSLELRQERLNKKIDKLEEEAVNDKPWQLKGEIHAENRPQNSLLQEVLEFDMTSRPAPVITEQTSLQLEDIIRQRIKDKVFDSVERKIKPIETPLEFKKKLVLDQEKSKESLAQIYEKEYLQQQAALNPENVETEKELESHKEIKEMMKNLFNKLDALSNFHFTSKPAIPDLKIISNLPAVNMEEVAPVAVSDATLLAPEEVRRKTKGDVIGKNERTKTDKNRERRKKKLKQKIHAKQKIKKEAAKGVRNISGVPVKYGAQKSKTKKG